MRFNLLKRKLKIKRKTIRTAKETIAIWAIAKLANDKRYFLYNIDEETGGMIWTSDRNEAIEFYTQQAVDYFIHANIKRKDVFVVQRRETVDRVQLFNT